jgi:hypothetical protein
MALRLRPQAVLCGLEDHCKTQQQSHRSFPLNLDQPMVVSAGVLTTLVEQELYAEQVALHLLGNSAMRLPSKPLLSVVGFMQQQKRHREAGEIVRNTVLLAPEP